MIVVAENMRLAILKRAREILSVKERWGKTHLRRNTGPNGAPQYCVLGACEQAFYDLGYKHTPGVLPFTEDMQGLGYVLGKELSLSAYARERYGMAPWRVNDRLGYEKTVEMLDEYIEEVEAGRTRPVT
jgi:hypothetical protein